MKLIFEAIIPVLSLRRIKVTPRTRLVLVMLFGGVALLLQTGCASVVKGTTDTIMVSAVGCEEYGIIYCQVTNEDGTVRVRSPGAATMEKNNDPVTVECESADGTARGVVVVDSTYEAMNAGNIILGGGVGMIVDAATGAMWKYPESINVPMDCSIAANSTPSSDAPDGGVEEPAGLQEETEEGQEVSE